MAIMIIMISLLLYYINYEKQWPIFQLKFLRTIVAYLCDPLNLIWKILLSKIYDVGETMVPESDTLYGFDLPDV